jgi:predicted site-specific integrase-resolvase
MTEKAYSTLDAAKKAGIHRATLIRWLQDGHVKASTEVPFAGGKILRRFTDSDVEKIKAYRNEHYWEMPGAKRFKKAKS